MTAQGLIRYAPLAQFGMAIRSSLLFAMLFFFWNTSPASNFQVSNGQLSEDARQLSFTVSWDHAWNFDGNGIGNHDAVWFFVKYQVDNAFAPLRFSNQALHQSSATALLQVEPVADGQGVFLVPQLSGGGNIPPTTITLELAAPLPDFSQIEIRAYGIEMVHVPTSDFYLGDGSSNHSFTAGDSSGPFLIQSEAQLPTGSSASSLTSVDAYPPAGDIPPSWPKGHTGFYCMKYEISQAQFTDFLNALTYAQQTQITATPPDGMAGSLALNNGLNNRNGIRLQRPGSAAGTPLPARYGHDLAGNGSFNGAGEGQARACNWLDWPSLCAYLDWAALRPMTEFEFEKASRGPALPMALEFAWGTPEVVDANTPLNDGFSSEAVAEVPTGQAGLASHGYVGPQGPLRCGFAAHSGSNRLAAGASYWGIMELSGNLWEQCVTVNAAGLAFTGALGDGQLGSDGKANVAGWPGAEGAGFRGGAWNSGILPGFRDLAVSDRFYAGLAPDTRRNTTGGRGVR